MKRSVTSSDSQNYVMIPNKKVTRSKSSSVIPGLSYKERMEQIEKLEATKAVATGQNPVVNEVPYQLKQVPIEKTNPVFSESANNDSAMNETLMLTTPELDLGQQFPTIIKRTKLRTPNLFQPVTTDSNINAISPLTDSSIDMAPKTATSDEVSPVQDQPQEEIDYPLTGTSILDPLRGTYQNTGPVFTEPSDFWNNSDGESQNSVIKTSPVLEPTHDAKSEPASPGSSHSTRPTKLKKHKRSKWSICTTIVMTIIAALCIATTVISFIVLSSGTRDIVVHYFENQDQESRMELLSYLTNRFGDSEILNTKSVPIIQPEIAEIFNMNLGINNTAFKGIGYSPLNSMEPECGLSYQDVKKEMALLSKITTKVRNYGVQCNQTQYILDAIIELDLKMTLTMGVWIGSNDTINQSQIDVMKSLLTKYPRKLFNSVLIGNEVLFRNEKLVDQLLNIIRGVKHFVKSIGYINLPIGTSEIGSLLEESLFEECDVLGANIHPFFSGRNVSQATDWTYDFLKYQLEPINSRYNKSILITEVGWPYTGGSYREAIANPFSFKEFMKSWICDPKKDSHEWYYFEAFDEPWKLIFYEGTNAWETEWGIFTNDGQLKQNFSFPSCS